MAIKTGIPIPARRGRPTGYQELYDLKPGQCAVFDISKEGEDQRIRSAAAYVAKTRNCKFVTRSDAKTKQFKVWLKPEGNE